MALLSARTNRNDDVPNQRQKLYLCIQVKHLIQVRRLNPSPSDMHGRSAVNCASSANEPPNQRPQVSEVGTLVIMATVMLLDMLGSLSCKEWLTAPTVITYTRARARRNSNKVHSGVSSRER